LTDAIVLGTRPEIIKCAPIIKRYGKMETELTIIHTNQHYSRELDEVFFEDLHLRKPDFNLGVGSGSQAEQAAKIMVGVEKLLLSEKIKRVIVQGDTNSVLGAALAASKIGVDVVHVEAGLRSHDTSMPEEINRIVTDHVSSILFPPAHESADNLYNEGIPQSKVFVVGNTIVESTVENAVEAGSRFKKISEIYGVQKHGYNLMTMHRPSNVDTATGLVKLVSLMNVIVKESGHGIVFPVHPRTRASIEANHVKMPATVKLIEPLGYIDFLSLEKNAALIFTDSGGVQEEACILRRPCITLRNNTERPETVYVGANIVTGINAGLVRDAIKTFSERKMDYTIPFGSTASASIYKILNS